MPFAYSGWGFDVKQYGGLGKPMLYYIADERSEA